jgi:uncharacterized protein (TIGR02147 family)
MSILIYCSSDHNFRSALRNVLDERIKRNPKYSLRSFARDLKLSASSLSSVLSGSQNISAAKAGSIGECLGLNQDERRIFVEIVKLHQNQRALAIQNLESFFTAQKSIYRLPYNLFSMVADWRYLGLLTALNAKKVGGRLTIAKSWLGETLTEVRKIADLLETQGFLKSLGNDLFEVVHKRTLSSSETPVAAFRAFHRSRLNRVSKALDSVENDKRDVVSTLLVMRKEDVPLVKEEITKALNSIVSKFESNEEGDVLYQFTVALVPVVD